MNTPLKTALLVVAIGLSVVAAVRLLQPRAGTSPANPATSVARQAERAPSPRGTVPSPGIAPRGGILRDLPPTALPAASASGGEEAPAEEREPTAEDYVRQVQAEPFDESWARPTARTLEDDLREKGEKLGFRPRQVICRQASCFAELDFASLRAARQQFKPMFGPPDHIDCPLRFLLPKEGNEDAPTLGILIVNCRDKRAREATAAGVRD